MLKQKDLQHMLIKQGLRVYGNSLLYPPVAQFLVWALVTSPSITNVSMVYAQFNPSKCARTGIKTYFCLVNQTGIFDLRGSHLKLYPRR